MFIPFLIVWLPITHSPWIVLSHIFWLVVQWVVYVLLPTSCYLFILSSHLIYTTHWQSQCRWIISLSDCTQCIHTIDIFHECCLIHEMWLQHTIMRRQLDGGMCPHSLVCLCVFSLCRQRLLLPRLMRIRNEQWRIDRCPDCRMPVDHVLSTPTMISPDPISSVQKCLSLSPPRMLSVDVVYYTLMRGIVDPNIHSRLHWGIIDGIHPATPTRTYARSHIHNERDGGHQYTHTYLCLKLR